VAIGLACVLSVTTASRAADDPVALAESAAEASAATAEGKAFRGDVGVAFGRDHGKSIRDCATEVGRPDASEFVLLLQFSGSGAVQQALVKPSTNVAVCLRGKVKGWKVGVPPTAGTWVKLRIRRK
jgi:hypothetical protein